MFNKLRLTDVLPQLVNKRVFLRTDFNTPLKNNKVADNTRILESLPTITKLLENDTKGIVIASHLGRPNGMRHPNMSLLPVKDELEQLMKLKVKYCSDCVGEEALTLSHELKKGEILLLENLRYHTEEEGSSKDEKGNKVKASKESVDIFRKQLTAMGEVYVNDAFGTCHRAHSSIVGVDLPLKVAGLLLEKELEFFAKALNHPSKPVTVIIGGSKVKDKLPLIRNLITFADDIIIGGGMAFTFLHEIDKMEIGKSIIDTMSISEILPIFQEAEKHGVRIHLPKDFICATSPEDTQGVITRTEAQGITSDLGGYDIGPESVKSFSKVIAKSKTIIMNGPMGVFENEKFKTGTIDLVKEIVQASKDKEVVSVVGGGDTVRAVNMVDQAKNIISHISTGGGASIELLEGKQLPGVSFLSDR